MAGNIEKNIEHLNSETDKLLSQSLFNSALDIAENTITKISRQLLSINDKFHFSSVFLYGQCLFHLGRYREAINEFSKSLNNTNSRYSTAELYRWLGRCFMKLDTQEDFRCSLEYLNKALSLFNDLGSKKEIGKTYSDLVVTYAHLNRFEESEISFLEAEKIFNLLKERVEMARLQRRNVIFMESEISAPILEKLAVSFVDFGIPHERIMALNNAATEYLYLDNFDKSRELLEIALEESVDIGDFGLTYLYNNLCLTYFMQNELIKAKECIKLARSCRQREVEKLILEINESALIASTENINIALPLLKRAAQRATNTGEKAYLFPATVNLSVGYFIKGNFNKALAVLKEIRPEKINSYSLYKNVHWFRALAKCYKVLQKAEDLEKLYKEYSWCNDSGNLRYYESDFFFIDMQFWSD